MWEPDWERSIRCEDFAAFIDGIGQVVQEDLPRVAQRGAGASVYSVLLSPDRGPAGVPHKGEWHDMAHLAVAELQRYPKGNQEVTLRVGGHIWVFHWHFDHGWIRYRPVTPRRGPLETEAP